ncbi:MAG: hypothetical protein M1823_008641, partial [Watsoniomyces obsoletus]
ALIEMHGGQLTMESEPGVGTVVSFDLPVTDYLLVQRTRFDARLLIQAQVAVRSPSHCAAAAVLHCTSTLVLTRPASAPDSRPDLAVLRHVLPMRMMADGSVLPDRI